MNYYPTKIGETCYEIAQKVFCTIYAMQVTSSKLSIVAVRRD